jgi:hypothetical protein
MKRVRITAVIHNAASPHAIRGYIEHELHGEVEDLTTSPVDTAPTYAFDELVQSGKQVLTGLWIAAKGAVGLVGWSVSCIVAGLHVLWVRGAGSEGKKKKRGRREDV